MEICPADADSKEVVRKVALHCDLEYVQVSLKGSISHAKFTLCTGAVHFVPAENGQVSYL